MRAGRQVKCSYVSNEAAGRSVREDGSSATGTMSQQDPVGCGYRRLMGDPSARVRVFEDPETTRGSGQ